MTNCGGVTPFTKIAYLAEAFSLPVTSHGAHDVTVHLLAACPNRSYLEAHGFGLDRFITEPLAITGGFAQAPNRLGHGIIFDWAALGRFKRSSQHLAGGGCDEYSKAALGSVRAKRVAVARPAHGGTA